MKKELLYTTRIIAEICSPEIGDYYVDFETDGFVYSLVEAIRIVRDATREENTIPIHIFSLIFTDKLGNERELWQTEFGRYLAAKRA